jgi:predicted transcriptional regulator
MKQKQLQRPTLKEFRIMKYIWRWKVATTAALTARFYPDYHWDTMTTYWKLWRLKKRGLVTIVQTNLAQEYVWALTTAGFKVLLPDMPSLKEKGFASENVAHDLMVQAAHLGDYLPRGSARISVITRGMSDSVTI